MTEIRDELVRNLSIYMAKHKIQTVYNADQTAVFFEYLPKKTVNVRGEKTVWVKSCGEDKKRVSVMLLGDLHGNKYPPFIVVKAKPSIVDGMVEENNQKRQGFGRTMWISDVEPTERKFDMKLFCNARGWWNSGLSVEFLEFHFGSAWDDGSMPTSGCIVE